MAKKDIPFKQKLSTIAWAIKTLFSLARKDFSLLIISSIFTGLLPTIQMYFASRIVDKVVGVIANPPISFLDSELVQSAILLMLSTAFIQLVVDLLNDYKEVLRLRFTLKHLKFFEVYVAAKSEEFSLYEFEDTEVSDEIFRANRDIGYLRTFLWELVSTSVITIEMIVTAGVVLSFSPILFIYLVITAIPSAVMYNKYVIDSWRFYNSQTDSFRTRQFVFNHLENIDNFLENKVSGGIKYVTKFLRKLVARISEKEYKIQMGWVRSSVFTSFIDFFKDIFLQVFILFEIILRNLTIGDYSFYIGRSLVFKSKLSSYFNYITSLQEHALKITNLKSLLERVPKMKNGTRLLNVNSKAPEIELVNVSFRYPGSKKYALKNISMKLSPGDEIAIVGKNGSGKTTLIKLLLRFYDPTSGKILVNGVPLKELDLNDYYKFFGALFQEYITYQFLTIKDNISIGRNGKFDAKQVEEAQKLAEIYEKVIGLPLKDKHTLVKTFKNGTNFSRGEKQKLALARMFYRNSPVLILDEPTAAIDAEAEYKIFKRIYEFLENKTVLIISHRFSTVRNAKKIYVLENGQILEEGSHTELMKKNGKYAKTFNLQAKGYSN